MAIPSHLCATCWAAWLARMNLFLGSHSLCLLQSGGNPVLRPCLLMKESSMAGLCTPLPSLLPHLLPIIFPLLQVTPGSAGLVADMKVFSSLSPSPLPLLSRAQLKTSSP